ncbi:hypothetical protein [Aeromicrobium endophyticum]|nr:hypothetical protein [Aeromicrobium endophyticum]
MATVLTGAVLALAAGCGSDSSDGPSTDATASPTPSATISEAPSVDPQDPAAVELRGDWEIPSEQYTLHLVEDGTFVEDFQGVVDFRTGKYKVDGDTISLVGDDGNTDKGKIVGDTLEFTLGTANRVK